ncbi:hypothetical protein CDL12_17711 [Handroanthus impetiginosus]|uniref:Uncharacterized protein n=1 Tax=Handroanthus impetiginosus TaxID=429701 RepID=A0A2G9GXG8_9LAMI|nr:hypothetical protein CDL12_17711 [Handroanthus impetiginosus]
MFRAIYNTSSQILYRYKKLSSFLGTQLHLLSTIFILNLVKFPLSNSCMTCALKGSSNSPKNPSHRLTTFSHIQIITRSTIIESTV